MRHRLGRDPLHAAGGHREMQRWQVGIAERLRQIHEAEERHLGGAVGRRRAGRRPADAPQMRDANRTFAPGGRIGQQPVVVGAMRRTDHVCAVAPGLVAVATTDPQNPIAACGQALADRRVQRLIVGVEHEAGSGGAFPGCSARRHPGVENQSSTDGSLVVDVSTGAAATATAAPAAGRSIQCRACSKG